MAKSRRRLTKMEIDWVRRVLESSPQGQAPRIRWMARQLGVRRTSVIKSLGGWKGIQRGRPQFEKIAPLIQRNVESPVKIEPYQVDVSDKF